MFVTVDGFIAGPNGELDWMPGNGTPDTEVDAHMDRLFDTVDTMVLGRATYQLFADFWPTATTTDDPVADKLNSTPKVVFAPSLEMVEWGKWNNARLATGSAVDEIQKLKQQPGKDVVIFGGATLVQSFTALGLIDEYQLFLVPVLLGGGKLLFTTFEERVKLRLWKTEMFSSGVVLLTYSLDKKHPSPNGT